MTPIVFEPIWAVDSVPVRSPPKVRSAVIKLNDPLPSVDKISPLFPSVTSNSPIPTVSATICAFPTVPLKSPPIIIAESELTTYSVVDILVELSPTGCVTPVTAEVNVPV